jgi:hypothetical protein
MHIAHNDCLFHRKRHFLGSGVLDAFAIGTESKAEQNKLIQYMAAAEKVEIKLNPSEVTALTHY